jgi:hypothetical protein
VRLSKECWCDPCGTDSTSKSNFLSHLGTKIHKKSIIRVAQGRHLQHRYYVCHKSFDDARALGDHEKTDMHKKNAAAPDAAATAKAARAKAIADSPGAIEAAKAAILACNGDYTKAVSKFNTDINPVPDEAPEIFDFKIAAKSVSDDSVQQKLPDSSRQWGSKVATGSTSSKDSSTKASSTKASLPKVTSSKVSSAADMQSLFKKREHKPSVQTKLTFGVSTQIKSKRVSGEKR